MAKRCNVPRDVVRRRPRVTATQRVRCEHTLSHLPGTIATVLRARRTRKVLNAAKFPTGNAIVMYLHDHRLSNDALYDKWIVYSCLIDQQSTSQLNYSLANKRNIVYKLSRCCRNRSYDKHCYVLAVLIHSDILEVTSLPAKLPSIAISLSVCLYGCLLICLSVCLFACLKKYMIIFLEENFWTCYLWPWLGPATTMVHNMLSTSGFVADVTFPRKGTSEEDWENQKQSLVCEVAVPGEKLLSTIAGLLN